MAFRFNRLGTASADVRGLSSSEAVNVVKG